MSAGEDTPKKSPGRGNPANLMPPWQPGQSGNPAGRPKGSRTKLAEDFCQALLDDFAQGGVEAIRVMREEKPNEYVKAIASILPKEVDLSGEVGISDWSERAREARERSR